LFLPLAHQGGWDEVLLVVAPLALIGLLLYVANRRVNAQLQQASDAQTETAEPSNESARDTETAEPSNESARDTETAEPSNESEDWPA
jgi:FtsZ-interacting cell division protein ZipA